MPADRADEARTILADADPVPARRNPLLRVIAVILLVAFVLVWVPGVINALLAVFGSR